MDSFIPRHPGMLLAGIQNPRYFLDRSLRYLRLTAYRNDEPNCPIILYGATISLFFRLRESVFYDVCHTAIRRQIWYCIK